MADDDLTGRRELLGWFSLLEGLSLILERMMEWRCFIADGLRLGK